MKGREDQKVNDLFFTCSLIGYIARKTKNRPQTVVDALGKTRIEKILELADVYHSDNIDAVSDAFIEECGMVSGHFDNVSECLYAVPTHWDIGKVYKRLILMAAEKSGETLSDTLIRVYHSPTSELIEDYNGSFFYDNPQSIFATYENGGVPE